MEGTKSKVLVCGDVNGQFKKLFSRVISINQKSGPFDFLLCVGDFFGEPQLGWEAYKNGSLKVPLPVYILGPNKGEHVNLYRQNDSEICPNVNYLGKRGILASGGLKIAYLSGKESTVSDLHTFTKKDVTSARDIAFKGQSNFVGVDILLTSEWPDNITQHDPKPGIVPPKGSPCISWLACQLKPRYHFCGLENIFYERPPYINYGDATSHSSRFIALGKVGNETKQKWIYAASLTPIDQMKGNLLYQPTTDQTECPYPIHMSRPDTTCDFKHETTNQFFYDMNADYEDTHERKRKRKDSDGSVDKRPGISQEKCWFCLASPSVEKHLVISIGEEMYLALAKGGLTPEHLMILPVQHHQTSAHLSDEAKKEVKKFKSSLKKFFKTENKVPVYFERNYKTSHLQLQVIPVPIDCVFELSKTFQSIAEEQDLHLDELPHHAQLEDIAPVGTPYFYVELPDGDRLFCRCRKNFPLHFGRDVLAEENILNLPDRINWRDCILDKDKEIKLVQNFREKYKNFDFTID